MSSLNFDFIGLELDNRQPIYIQVVKYFKVQIHLGKLKSGDEIPSRRVLAAMLNINPATVQKAYKEMEDEGLIGTMNNSKSLVSVDSEALKKIRKELTENEVRDFLKTAKKINLSFKDVIDLISELWDKS
jgi:DNA-binding transcriptional regulator YhcF (GntR family)